MLTLSAIAMVQLVEGTNSLTIVFIIYLNVLTSPFHKYYHPQCTDCQTLDSNNSHRHPKHTQTVKSRNITLSTTTATPSPIETIIVSDPTTEQEQSFNVKQQGSIETLDTVGGITYCDRLSTLRFGNKSMYCIDHDYCPTKLSELEAEQVRQLACGLKYDGSIKVCCKLTEFESKSLFKSSDMQVENEKNEPSFAGRAVNETVIITDDNAPLQVANLTSNGKNRNSKSSGATGIDVGGKTKFLTECGVSIDSENSDETRIIGGETARRDAWPWFALIMVQRGTRHSPECGATLITNKFVLTAAHCVLEQNGRRQVRKSRLLVRLGEFDLKKTNEGELDVGVANIYVHPQFHQKTFKNDIALIELNKEIEFNNQISPACLPHDDLKLANQMPGAVDNQTAWVLGFGQTSYNGRTSDKLKQADLRIVQHTKCKRAFEHIVRLTRDYVCASSQSIFDEPKTDSVESTGDSETTTNPTESSRASKIKDSCQGDSGGPLMMIPSKTKPPTSAVDDTAKEDNKPTTRWYIYGIVSFGYRCASSGFPGVYTRVNRYLDWIETHI